MTTENHKKNFIGTSETSLKKVFGEWEPYRIHQIFNWVYHYGCRDFFEMTNLLLLMAKQQISPME